jgi:hypothetical protein
MVDSIDWSDETSRPHDQLARPAFPDGGVTAKTLRRRARVGKLAAYRPGKAYLASLSGVREMIKELAFNAACEHWEAHRSRKAAAKAVRGSTPHRVERWSAGNRDQFQILS